MAWYCNAAAQLNGSTSLNDGSWHYVVGTLSSSTTGTTTALYVDGSAQATGSSSGYAGQTPTVACVGTAATSSGCPDATAYFNGSIDEVRHSTCAGSGCTAQRSADWVLSEYNDQKNPGNIGSANFLIWISATPPSGYVRHRVIQ